MIGVLIVVGAILSALVLGLAVIVLDLRTDIRAHGLALATVVAALPRKRTRKPKAVQS